MNVGDKVLYRVTWRRSLGELPVPRCHYAVVLQLFTDIDGDPSVLLHTEEYQLTTSTIAELEREEETMNRYLESKGY